MKKTAYPKQATKILNGPKASSLQPLLSYANYLQHQSKQLCDSLSEPIASHIALANMRHGVATIVVDSSTWLGKVRYLGPIIQQTLIKQGLIINQVVFKADPTYHLGRKFEHPPAVMPAAAGELLHDFANSVSNPKLQAALHRLAKHGKQADSQLPQINNKKEEPNCDNHHSPAFLKSAGLLKGETRLRKEDR